MFTEEKTGTDSQLIRHARPPPQFLWTVDRALVCAFDGLESQSWCSRKKLGRILWLSTKSLAALDTLYRSKPFPPIDALDII